MSGLNEHEKQARDFLDKFGLKMSITYVTHEVPLWDNRVHPKYRVRITRKQTRQSISWYFYDSLYNDQMGKRPTPYDVLACISNDTYVYDNFEEFCDAYGYSNDSIRAFKTWKLYDKLSKRLNRFFTEKELEALREIQ